MYSSVIDVGEKLRIDSDPETSAAIQEGLSQLQQNWGDTQVQLENMKMKLSSVLQVVNALPREEQHPCFSQELSCPTIPMAELCSSTASTEQQLTAEDL